MGRHGVAPSRKTAWGKLGSIVASLAMVATGAVVIPALAATAADADSASSLVPSSLVCTLDANDVPSVTVPESDDRFTYAQPPAGLALGETYTATVSFGLDDDAARAAVQAAGWTLVGDAPQTQGELPVLLDETNCDRAGSGAKVAALAAPEMAAKTDFGYEDLCLSDGNPNIYVGGDFTTPGFNEVGSPFVVNGNATFNGGGAPYNGVGAASGSETWPKPGEVALRVGGSFAGMADVRGESSSADIAVRIGGTNTGTITTADDVQADLGSAAALGPFANWQSSGVLARAAQYYLTTPATPGTITSGSLYSLTGSQQEQQSFTIPATDLSGPGGLAMNFVDMSATKFIIIKVTGNNPTINVPSVWVDGAQPSTIVDPKYQSLAKRIVWVFPDATNITFSGNGQIPGSVIAPKANVTVTMAGGGLNGRLWAGGDVAFNVSGGWEVHLFGILTCPKPPVDVTPVAPVVTQATCDADGNVVAPSVTATDTEAIKYTMSPDAPKAGDQVTVTATIPDSLNAQFPAEKDLPDGWTRAGDRTATYTLTLAAPTCAPQPPIATAQACSEVGDPLEPTVTLPASGDAVTYTSEVKATATGWTVTVTAAAEGAVTLTAAGDWRIATDGKSATWTKQFTAADCGTAPVEPTVTPSTCVESTGLPSNPTVTLPSNGNGISYTKSGAEVPGGTVLVTATIDAGVAKKFPADLAGWDVATNGKSATKTINLNTPTCAVPPLTDPHAVDSQCTDGGVPSTPSVDLPANTTRIHYAKTGSEAPGGTVVITATAQAGFEFAATVGGTWVRVSDTEATWTKKFAEPDCSITPVPPTATEAQCAAYGQVQDPTLTFDGSGGVTYRITSGTVAAGQTVTVTATAPTGTSFPAAVKDWKVVAGGRTATWTHTFTVIDCTVPLTVQPQAADVICAADGTPSEAALVVPTDGNDITYAYDAAKVKAGGTVVVTATLDASANKKFGTLAGEWTLDPGSNGQVATWTFTFADPDCSTSVVPVDVDEATCAADGSVVAPVVEGLPASGTDSRGVTYALTGTVKAGETVTVTATAPSGKKFTFVPDGWTIDAGGRTATWKHTFAPVDCTPPVTTTPPTTPTTPPTAATVTPAVDGTQCIEVGDVNAITVTTAERNGIVYTVRGNGSGEVTITAEAKGGFELAVPAGWTKVGSTATITITPASDGVICVAGESSVVPSASASVTVVQPSVEVQGEHDEIAYTGVNTMGLLSIALLLLGGGAIVLGLGTRRRGSQRQH